jgi:hypothetical protein
VRFPAPQGLPIDVSIHMGICFDIDQAVPERFHGRVDTQQV